MLYGTHRIYQHLTESYTGGGRGGLELPNFCEGEGRVHHTQNAKTLNNTFILESIVSPSKLSQHYPLNPSTPHFTIDCMAM